MSEMEQTIKRVQLPTDAIYGDTYFTPNIKDWLYVDIPEDFCVTIGMTVMYDSIILPPFSHLQLVYTGGRGWGCITSLGNHYICNFEIHENKKSNWLTRIWKKITRIKDDS